MSCKDNVNNAIYSYYTQTYKYNNENKSSCSSNGLPIYSNVTHYKAPLTSDMISTVDYLRFGTNVSSECGCGKSVLSPPVHVAPPSFELCGHTQPSK